MTESDTKREEALDFLADLEARHNSVLDELEALDKKVEQVLEQYLVSREQSQAADQPSADGESTDAKQSKTKRKAA